MVTESIKSDIEKRISGLDLGIELITAEVAGTNGDRTLRIYIDHPAGVDHDLCASVTSTLKDLLESYRLEVSSPGEQRPLVSLDHFKRFCGSRAYIKTRGQVEGRCKFKGELAGVQKGQVVIVCDGSRYQIPQDEISSSHLMPGLRKGGGK